MVGPIGTGRESDQLAIVGRAGIFPVVAHHIEADIVSHPFSQCGKSTFGGCDAGVGIAKGKTLIIRGGRTKVTAVFVDDSFLVAAETIV